MRKNWQGEKFQKLPEERKIEIRQKVEQGYLKAVERRKELDEYKLKMKKGRKFIRDNKVKMFRFVFGNNCIGEFIISVGVNIDRDGCPDIDICYAACSPSDVFSYRVARGLIGHRFLESEYSKKDIFCVSKEIVDNGVVLLKFIESNVVQKILFGEFTEKAKKIFIKNECFFDHCSYTP